MVACKLVCWIFTGTHFICILFSSWQQDNLDLINFWFDYLQVQLLSFFFWHSYWNSTLFSSLITQFVFCDLVWIYIDDPFFLVSVDFLLLKLASRFERVMITEMLWLLSNLCSMRVHWLRPRNSEAPSRISSRDLRSCSLSFQRVYDWNYPQSWVISVACERIFDCLDL